MPMADLQARTPQRLTMLVHRMQRLKMLVHRMQRLNMLVHRMQQNNCLPRFNFYDCIAAGGDEGAMTVPAMSTYALAKVSGEALVQRYVFFVDTFHDTYVWTDICVSDVDASCIVYQDQ